MRACALLAPIVVLGLMGVGCGRPASSPAHAFGDGRLALSGSSTIAPLVSEIAKRFEAKHPGVRIDVQTGGSSRGVADVRRGSVNVGMVSRTLAPGEEGLTAHTIAMDGVAVIVHATNPVAELSGQQIVDIYTGRVTNWSAVGGNAAPITVVNKADGRSTLELFASHFKLERPAIKAHVVIGENLHGVRTVVGDPNAIGYVSIGTAEFERSNRVPIKLLPLGGVPATMGNVRAGRFPLSRPLNLVTLGQRSALVDAFIAMASSTEVNDLVEAQFFVPTAK
jgi:phosphate transport system substrate-binding protein